MKRYVLPLAAVLAFSSAGTGPVSAEIQDRETQAIQELLDEFTQWIEKNTDLRIKPLAAEKVKFVEPGDLVIADGKEHWIRQRNRGLYDIDKQIVYLTRPWDYRDTYDQSVLLHELIHHGQVEARHWYCPRAMEWDAYELQEIWLAEQKIDPGFNWTAILLESSCAPRDHHPD